MESKNDLREQSIEFAIAVSDACDDIIGLSVYVNQLLRCSSSIGANLHEAKYAQSRADFISKLEIALKESSETEYWLELIYRKKKLSDEQYRNLKNTCVCGRGTVLCPERNRLKISGYLRKLTINLPKKLRTENRPLSFAKTGS